MLRASDYIYSGYGFDEELILPQTTRTFGKIWVTDQLGQKRINSGDYLTLCLVDTLSHLNYHIKYAYHEKTMGDYWSEEMWLETSDK